MNYEDIILLVKAGYTRDQIAAMQAPAQTAQAEPTPPAPAEPAQAAPAEPQAQPKPQGIEDLSQMLAAEFAKLKAARRCRIRFVTGDRPDSNSGHLCEFSLRQAKVQPQISDFFSSRLHIVDLFPLMDLQKFY